MSDVDQAGRARAGRDGGPHPDSGDTQDPGDLLPGADHPPAERLRAVRRRLEGLLGIPTTEGNEITVLRNGDEIFPAMLRAIREAEHTVDFLTYIYWTGDVARAFAEALAERARAGVRVRVLVDAVGGRQMPDELFEELERAGAQTERFRPPWKISPFKQNHRTHRKVLVVDEDVAFTGGVGIAEEWEGDARNPDEFRDTQVQVRGPAVDGLRAAFAQNWAETGRPLSEDADRFPEQPQVGSSTVQVVRGSATIGWNDVETVLRVMVHAAAERVRIATGYLSPDDDVIDLLGGAVRRGVDVDVVTPGQHTDKQATILGGNALYDRLLDAGVRIWEFQPTMMHCKVVTVDGLVGVVGSTNLNTRSMRHDEEVMLVVLDPDVVKVLDRHFEEDLTRAELIDPDRWADRSLPQKVAEKAILPIRRWM